VAIVVEDGTGLSTANSYLSVADAKVYWTDRGFVYSGYTDPQIAVALIQATDYIEARYGSRFFGVRLVASQALSFPRSYLYDLAGNAISGVPARLEAATAEYAQRALVAALAPDPVFDDTGTTVMRKREKVGPIETDISYTGGGPSTFRPYPMADALLADYASAAGSRVERA
jgi:hypothetical protein